MQMKKYHIVFISFFFMTFFLSAKENIGLVLSGGGAKGAYEVGVWAALEEYGLTGQISIISGTSVGALNAALFACNDAQKARELWQTEVGYSSFLMPDGDNIVSLTLQLAENIKTGAARQRESKQQDSEEISKIKSILYSIQGGSKSIGSDTKEFIKDYLTKDEHTEGLFERDALEEIIQQNVSLQKIKASGKEIYVTSIRKRLLAEKLYSKKFLKFLLGDDYSHSFLLNEQISDKNIKSLLLASSALPLVYPSQFLDSSILQDGSPIEASEYIDGGFEEVGGKNIQVEPVANSKADTVIIVYLRSLEEMTDKDGNVKGRIVKEDIHNKRLIEIIPSESLNKSKGTLDFSTQTVDKLIKLGYQDTVKILKENGYSKQKSLEKILEQLFK